MKMAKRFSLANIRDFRISTDIHNVAMQQPSKPKEKIKNQIANKMSIKNNFNVAFLLWMDRKGDFRLDDSQILLQSRGGW